jgi:hypothetical protein
MKILVTGGRGKVGRDSLGQIWRCLSKLAFNKL